MNQKHRENDYIDLAEIWSAFIQYGGKIILTATLCGIAGFIYAFFLVTPLYNANAMMIVNSGDQYEYVTQDQLNSATRLVEIYSVIIKSGTVMNKVRSNLDIDQDTYKATVKNISVTSVNETQIMEITVTATDPEVALDVCKEITNVAPKVIIKTVKAGSVELVSKASTTHKKVSPNIKRTVLFSIVFGFIMATITVMVITLMDNKVKGENDIRQAGIVLLGAIPSYEIEDKQYVKKII